MPTIQRKNPGPSSVEMVPLGSTGVRPAPESRVAQPNSSAATMLPARQTGLAGRALQRAQSSETALLNAMDTQGSHGQRATQIKQTYRQLQQRWQLLNKEATEELARRKVPLVEAERKREEAKRESDKKFAEKDQKKSQLAREDVERQKLVGQLASAEQEIKEIKAIEDSGANPGTSDAARKLGELFKKKASLSGDLVCVKQRIKDCDRELVQLEREAQAALDALIAAEAARVEASKPVERLLAEQSKARDAGADGRLVSRDEALSKMGVAHDKLRHAHLVASDDAVRAAHLEQDRENEQNKLDSLQTRRNSLNESVQPNGVLGAAVIKAATEAQTANELKESATLERNQTSISIRSAQAEIEQLNDRAGLLQGGGANPDELLAVQAELRSKGDKLNILSAIVREAEKQFEKAERAARSAADALQMAANNKTVAESEISQIDGELEAVQRRLTELVTELRRLEASASGVAGRDAAVLAAAEGLNEARNKLDLTLTPAGAAEKELETALNNLLSELKPDPPLATAAPVLPPLSRRLADGLRGVNQGWVQGTSPAQYSGQFGPLAGSAASFGSPTLYGGGSAPGRSVTEAAMSSSGLNAIDKKAKQAAQAAAHQMIAGVPRAPLFGGAMGVAATPTALQLASAFSSEVSALFDAPKAGSASLTPDVLANRLLQHPNPDPVSRPDGHPLRHERALLVASALSAVTTDPAQAALVYKELWNGAPSNLRGMIKRDSSVEYPLASLDALLPHRSATDNIAGLAHQARRLLAASPSGMQALMHLQGLSLPPQGVTAEEATARAEAERTLEHYQLMLRAETALQGRIGLGATATTEEVLKAVDLPREALNLALEPALKSDLLGVGRRRTSDGLVEVEHPQTLAIQAFKYAHANLIRTAQGEELKEYKPAYVALRNGFTESGERSDFNAMAKRLHKFIHHIDLATDKKPSVATMWGRATRQVLRMAPQEMSPLTTLLKAGRLGVDLGQVPAEYRKQLDGALDKARGVLRKHFTAMPEADRTLVLVRLAALEEWASKLQEKTTEPYASIELTATELWQRVGVLATELSSAGAVAVAVPNEDARKGYEAFLSAPMSPQLLETWLGKGPLACPLPTNDADLLKLRESLPMLQGKGPFVSDLADLQREFDAATDAKARRDVLRKLLIGVVAGGDIAEYSAGRKTAVVAKAGISPGGVAVGDRTLGLTLAVEGTAELAKTTVLRGGVASNSGVLYLAEETKVGLGLGGGLRAGFQPEVPDVKLGSAVGGIKLGVSVGAMARLGGTHVSSTGLMIRTSRQGQEHASLGTDGPHELKSTNWKRMSELVVHTIFDLADSEARPENPNQMWTQVVSRLGDYQDISFGYHRTSTTSASWSLQADGQLGVDLVQLAPSLSRNFLNRGNSTETGGSMRTFQGSSGRKTAGSLAGELGISSPLFHTDNGGTMRLMSHGKFGVESEMVFNGSNGLVRLTIENGRLNPDISFKHREFAVESDFFKLLNVKERRDEWVPRLGERGPDGLMHGGDEALNRFMREVANLPPGKNRVFIERKNMRTEAAETVNALLTRLGVLQNAMQQHAIRGTKLPPNMTKQVQALGQRIADEVDDEKNWQPFRLFVNEVNTMQRTAGVEAEGRYDAAPFAGGGQWVPDTANEAVRNSGAKFGILEPIGAARGGRDLLIVDAQPKQDPRVPEPAAEQPTPRAASASATSS